MNPPASSSRKVRTGLFEIDLASGEVRKNGRRLPLQEQPFRVLAMLLERPGEVVTRQELQARVWPVDTYVGFDEGLNTAIRKLRTTFGDSAGNPRFIETLPRRGYRFIAPVTETAPVDGLPSSTEVRGEGAQIEGHAGFVETIARRGYQFIGAVKEPSSPALLPSTPKERFERPTERWRLQWVVSAFLVLLLSGIGIWIVSRKVSVSLTPALEVVPLVAMPGEEKDPAFSPDGNQVAFRHSGANSSGIYTTLIDGEKPLRLTNNPGDSNPTWSPDGRQIAFARSYAEEGRSMYVVPALGGTEHKLYTTRNPYAMNGYLNWSPDGKVLAFSEGGVDSFSFRIALLSLADLTARPLTSPPPNKGDWGPAFSPDGSTVAFVRSYAPGWLGDLFVLPAKGGEPRQLTFDNCELYGLSWTEDGKDIVFSSSRSGVPSLWRISALGGAPRPVPGTGTPADSPSISRKGDRLVYAQSSFSTNVWRLDLKSEKTPQGPPVRVTATSRGINYRPSLSPDGKKMALESDRLGYSDIWYCDNDGSNCARLTSLHGGAGTARVSPDGHYVVFEFRRQEHEGIYVVEVPGGRPRLLPTFPGADNGAPNWSRDGQWIYFYSDHQGRPFQLWKVPLKGGPPVRVTRNGGLYGIESEDRRFLYYSKYTQPGIWRMPLAGGEEVRILDEPGGRQWFSWALSPNGIYFLGGYPPDGTIKLFDFATGKIISIFVLEKSVPFFGGLALSPDGKSLFFGQIESSDSYITLVKNFR
jgi:Tol biopolymer transport system component/DNA-binding winged helix-turn-helix (wHTH) protein